LICICFKLEPAEHPFSDRGKKAAGNHQKSSVFTLSHCTLAKRRNSAVLAAAKNEKAAFPLLSELTKNRKIKIFKGNKNKTQIVKNVTGKNIRNLNVIENMELFDCE
jgi:hypothetical protein